MKNFIIILTVGLLLVSCDYDFNPPPFSPDFSIGEKEKTERQSKSQYRESVEVIYTRNTSYTVANEDTEEVVKLTYELEDYSGETYAPGEVINEEPFTIERVEEVIMKVVGKNKFRTRLKHVLIDGDWWHFVTIGDPAVPSPTPLDVIDVEIEGAYELSKIIGMRYSFKMSKE